MNIRRNQETSVVDVCSGNVPGELFLVCNNHDDDEFLESVKAILVHVKIDGKNLQYSVLFNALDHVPDDIPTAHCVARNASGSIYMGESAGFIKYSAGKIEAVELGNAVQPGGIILCAYAGSNNDIFFGTGKGEIVNVNGSAFTSQKIVPIPPGKNFQFINRIHGIGSAFMVAVGDAGMVTVFRDGQWAKVACPSNVNLHGVWCRNEKEIYIGGRSGLVWRWDGDGRWQKLSADFAGDENRFDFLDLVEYQGDIYAACGRDGVSKLCGDKFATMPDVGAKLVGRLSATTSGLIGVGTMWGNDGNWFTRFDGKTWTSEQISIKL